MEDFTGTELREWELFWTFENRIPARDPQQFLVYPLSHFTGLFVVSPLYNSSPISALDQRQTILYKAFKADRVLNLREEFRRDTARCGLIAAHRNQEGNLHRPFVPAVMCYFITSVFTFNTVAR